MVKTWKSACIAAACTLATAAQAAVMASVTGSCGKHVGGLLDDIPSFTGCPGGFWADSRPGARSTGSWSGTAQVGALGASASIAIDTTPPLGQTLPLALGVSVDGLSGFSDDVLFSAPGLAGAPGKLRFSMAVDGSMAAAHVSPHAAASASWKLTATSFQTVSGRLRQLGSASVGSKLENFYDWGVTGTPNVDGLYNFELPVVFGETLLLALQLQVRAGASGWRGGFATDPAYNTPVQSVAAASFGNTALWQGIDALTLTDGTAVPGWTVSAVSGFNYAQPVPEPSMWALLLLGLGGVGWVARRRRLA